MPMDIPSSSWSRKGLDANMDATTDCPLSSVPLPYTRPSLYTPSYGGVSHRAGSPAGTTSMWETIHTVPFLLPFLRARMLGLMTEGSTSSRTSILSTESKPLSLDMR